MILEISAWIAFTLWVGLTTYSIYMTYNSFKHKQEKFEKTKKELPLVSVVLPARNEEPVIEYAINSILDQDYPKDKMEIILIEDCSIDKTGEIIDKYRSENVKVFHRKESKGKPDALNFANQHITGKYVLYVDADTFLDKSFLRNAVIKAEQGYDVVQGFRIPITKDNILGKLYRISEYVFSDIVQRHRGVKNTIVLNGQGMLMKADFVKEGWDDSIVEDMDISLRGHLKNLKFAYVPIKYHTEFPSEWKSIVNQRKRWHRGSIRAVNKYLKKLWKNKKQLGIMRTIDLSLSILNPYILVLLFFASVLSLVLSWMDMWSVVFGKTALIMITTSLAWIYLVHVFATLKNGTPSELAYTPLIGLFWVADQFIAIQAIFDELVHKPAAWNRTKKTGEIRIFMIE